MTRTSPMILGAVLSPTSTHIAGWRHPEAVSNAGATLADMRRFARDAEAAALDFVFLADELSAPDVDAETLSRDPVVYRFEPLTLTAALAAVTERIGLIVTQTTSYNEPYHVARKLASIDNLSEGRVGWNLVTSYVTAEAAQFGAGQHAGYAERYARAEEFLTVAKGLWDSWDDDTFVLDRESGRYFDPDGLRLLDHHGDSFDVRGPLNIVRPVQGHPVLVQAGSSDTGMAFAARFAELVFTAQTALDGAAVFTDDLRTRTEAAGRSRDSIRVIAGTMPVVAETEAEARAKHEALQALIHPAVGLARLSQLLGFDVTGMPLDARLGDEIPETDAYRSRQALIVELARREDLTIGELYPRVVGSYGHRTLIGSASQVADGLEEWFAAGAVDGYILTPTHLPGGLDDIAHLLLPELRRRGLARQGYEGTTLREHLGLDRPIRSAS